MANDNFKELTVYKKAFALAMQIFKTSKNFPQEEKFGLTSQIRRSSRSVCASIAEGYRKRKYPAHFVSKASDSDMENGETQVWLHFALECEYINHKEYSEMLAQTEEVGKLLNHMMTFPEKYVSKGEK